MRPPPVCFQGRCEAGRSAYGQLKAAQTLKTNGIERAVWLLRARAVLDVLPFPLQVDEYLRVLGHDRLFAVGDATDVKETKLGYLAKAQVCAMTIIRERRSCRELKQEIEMFCSISLNKFRQAVSSSRPASFDAVGSARPRSCVSAAP